MSQAKDFINQLNAPEASREERVAKLIKACLERDALAKEYFEKAKWLKERYDREKADAAELRAELLKYGVVIYPETEE